MSLNFGQIPPLTTELAAPERLKYLVCPGFIPIVLLLADNQNWHNILNKLRVTCLKIMVSNQ